MLSSTAGGLLHVNIVFITIRAIYQEIYYDDSSLWHRNVKETILRQTLVFDPGGCSGRLHGCLFLGERRAFFRGGTRLER